MFKKLFLLAYSSLSLAMQPAGIVDVDAILQEHVLSWESTKKGLENQRTQLRERYSDKDLKAQSLVFETDILRVVQPFGPEKAQIKIDQLTNLRRHYADKQLEIEELQSDITLNNNRRRRGDYLKNGLIVLLSGICFFQGYQYLKPQRLKQSKP